MGKKILIAMSGGVDSSVAALLLTEQGHDVAGVTMDLHRAVGAGEGDHRVSARAVEDARRVCEHLGMRHYSVDFSGPFERLVIQNFLAEYRRGRTPNPCVVCNRDIKFGLLLAKARELGFDVIATGHYAATAACGGKTVLRRAADARKDQSYFLYAVKSDALGRVVFPLAQRTKAEVTERARTAGLPAADSPESQDICFIPHGDYRRFFAGRHEHIPPGDIVDASGAVRGRHRGIPFYTIGQRSGLGIAAPAPLYVVAIDAGRNRLIVGEKVQVRARRLRAASVTAHLPLTAGRGMAKIRYAHRPAACSYSLGADGLDIVFDEAQEAITPGQSAVVYRDDMIVCGGIIEQVNHDD